VPVVVASDQSAVYVRAKPYDQTGVATPAAGTVASVTFAASPGKRYTCRAISAFLNQSSGGAGSAAIYVRDGASGSGTIIWVARLTSTATQGWSDNYFVTELGVRGSAGNAMAVEFSVGLAGLFEYLSAGVDLD